jgi:hypothetical protein
MGEVIDLASRQPKEEFDPKDPMVLARLKLLVDASYNDLIAAILKLDEMTGGGNADEAIKGIGKLAEILAAHYVTDRAVITMKHDAKFVCVPRRVWQLAKETLPPCPRCSGDGGFEGQPCPACAGAGVRSEGSCAECGLAADAEPWPGMAKCGQCGRGV